MALKKSEYKAIRSKVSDIVRNHLIRSGHEVKSSEDPSYNLLVDGKKCLLNCHQNINGGVIIEYVTSTHTMTDAGYDAIIYMDIAGGYDKFYIAPVTTVAAAINNRLGKSNYYFKVSRKDVLVNDGICVGITEKVFERIEGVVKFEL